MNGSVRLSVCPSVCHTFFTMFPSWYHNEIFRSYYQWQKRCPCKRWRSEVKVQGHNGENPISPFPDCNYSLNSHMAMKSCIKLHVAKERYPIVFQGYPSNFKVTRLKNVRFWHPKLGISGLWLQFEFTNGYEMMHKGWISIREVPYCFEISRSSVKFQGHTGQKNCRFWPELSVSVM